jgi:hypothetical protein
MSSLTQSHLVQHFDDRKETVVNGRLHSIDDKPAVQYANGDREWYFEGMLHRVGKPAVIKENMVKYYTYGAIEESPRESSPLNQTYDINFGDIVCKATKTCIFFEDKFLFAFSVYIPTGDHAGNYIFNIPSNWNIHEINAFNYSNTYLVAESNKGALSGQVDISIKLHLSAFDVIRSLSPTILPKQYGV